MKKILGIILGVLFMVAGGIGVVYAANPDVVTSAAARVTSVFVTNWPENQNVTITNTSPIPVSTSSGQAKWEYIGIGRDADMQTLNQYGSEGWEYAGFDVSTAWVFKRPIVQ